MKRKTRRNNKTRNNKTRNNKKGGSFYTYLFPKSCNVNSDCPEGEYCVLFRNEGLIPFYRYLHYFQNKPGQCTEFAAPWWKKYNN